MGGVLGEVEAVPVLSVADAEDEVDDFGPAFLPFLDSFRRVGVRGQALVAGNTGAASTTTAAALAKDTATVGESVADRGAELP